MGELRPKLIITKPRKKRGILSLLESFLIFAVVFGIGVYVGTKLDKDTDLVQNRSEQPATDTREYSDVGTAQLSEPTDIQEQSDITNSKKSVESVDSKAEVVGSDTRDYIPNSLVKTDEGRGSAIVVDDDSDETTAENTNLGDTPASSEGDIDIVVKNPDIPDKHDGDHKYTLQISAFYDLDKAEWVVNDLKSRGHDAYVVSVENSRGEVWNLVKVGNFDSFESASDYSHEFMYKEGTEAFVEEIK